MTPYTYIYIYKLKCRNKQVFLLPECSSRRLGPAGPRDPGRSGSGAVGVSAGLRGRAATPSALHHHLRGQRYQGNAPAGQRHGNQHQRGTEKVICVELFIHTIYFTFFFVLL